MSKNFAIAPLEPPQREALQRELLERHGAQEECATLLAGSAVTK